MNEEILGLHKAFIAQLKETATNSYNSFYRAYKLLNEDKYQSKDKFINILKNNDYVIASLDFYNDMFYALDRSEELLYIGQILSLQIKASHNLKVIATSEHHDEEANYYLTNKDKYKKELYFYYQFINDNEKIKLIYNAFIKDADISDDIKQSALLRYQEFLNRKGVK